MVVLVRMTPQADGTSSPLGHGRYGLLLTILVLLLAGSSFFLATRHMSHSVWFDESQTDLIGRQETLAGVAATALEERPYPPLFFWVMHYSLKLRGDEMGLRLPAALFGALAVIGVFLLGGQLTDATTGAIAALLFVLTPGVFRYFVDGNAYTLLMLEASLSTLYLLKAAHSDKTADWLCYGLFALLGLGTHSLFVFVLAAQLAGGLYLRASRRLQAVMSVLFLVAFAWALICLRYCGTLNPLSLSRVPEINTAIATAAMYAGPLSFGPTSQLVLWASLQMLGAAALFKWHRKAFWFVVVFGAVFLPATTVFLKATVPYVAYRYGLGMFPLASIVAAYSLRTRPALARACALIVITGYCVAGAAFILRADRSVFEYQNWEGAGGYLRVHVVPGDTVFLGRGQGLLPLRYYYKGPVTVLDAAALRDASRLFAGESGKPGPPTTRAWVILETFSNQNPAVARFTEKPHRGLEAQQQRLLAAVQKAGLFACETARFHRVDVLAVGRQSCPPE
jgi:hypothetical protein